jgi:hypothetical protein
MKKTLFIAIIILAIGAPIDLFAQATAKGIVYEDLNRNNKKEANEKGIANVAVSNGIEVVLTNSRGEYDIAVSDDTIVFVIKPSNYEYPLNAFNQPLFYHIHKPKGSPDLSYEGTPATGNLPASVDFGLYPAQTNNKFKILVFGDPQPHDRKQVDFFFRGIVSELLDVEDVAFGLSLGDLVNDGLELFRPYKNAVTKIGIPWHNVMGNHDMNTDVKTDTLSDETFERHFGPANYAFNHGMVHFIILDDILYPDPRDGKGYWGGFRSDQLKFIENDLKYVPKDHLIVLALHIPFREDEKYDSFRDEDRTKVFELLKNFPHTLSLSAHTHLQRQDFFYAKDGWLQKKPHHQYNVGTTSGDWYRGRLDKNGVPVSTMRDGTPKGYAYLHFDKNRYVIDYKVAGKPFDYQIRVHAPKVVRQAKWSSAAILANFFIGSERDTLFYRIDKGEWKKMYHYETYDPVYYQQSFEWDFTSELFEGSRPSYPTQCQHLWYGHLPADLALGEHAIEVKALDMFGRTFMQTSSYRIAKTP